MATVQDQPARQPTDKRFAESDPQMYHPLDRLRSIIRRYVVIEGVLFAILFLAVWLAVGLILDYGLFKLTGWDWVQDGAWWVRFVGLLIAGGVFASILIFRIVQRLTTELSYPSLALVLERRFPKVLGDRLITAVEMADVEAMSRYGYSKEMLRATIGEARQRVGTVPVQEVFNWRRLWTLGLLTIAVLATTLAFSYASYAIAARTTDPVRFGWKFAHVVGIFLERNVALMDTPWPRRAHLELVNFPPEGVLTVGRDADAPTITARAYQWVIADPQAPVGWRPLLWQDLTEELVGRPIPELPALLQNETHDDVIIVASSVDPQTQSTQSLWRSGPEPKGPSLQKVVRDGVQYEYFHAPTVDSVQWYAYEPPGEDATTDDGQRHAHIKAELGSRYDEIQEVFRALIAKADDPSMGRKLRRLDVPAGATFKFSGRRTAGSGDLPRKPKNQFIGVIADKDGRMPKEDVTFVVRAADFVTPAKKIRPIPPPSLKRLYREQAEPAYLHHAPPIDADNGFYALEGLLQRIATKDLSLTGERTVFAVPAGTQLTLRAEAYTNDAGQIDDVDAIASAVAIPRVGRFPGMKLKDGKPSEEPVPLPIEANGAGWSITFDNKLGIPAKAARGDSFLARCVAMIREATNFQLHENVEFRVEFANKYNVKTTRTFLIQVQQDQAPVVEVAADVIRKQGNLYLVTANARIPFNTDSFIKDDNGLSKVEYAFEYYPEDSDVVRGIRAKFALRCLLGIPLPGDWASAALPLAHADNLRFLDRGDNRLYGSAIVSEFNSLVIRLQRDNTQRLHELLATPKTDSEAPQTVRKVELKSQDRDYFDLKELNDLGKIDLRPKKDEVQSIFRMDLYIQATDTNVDNDTGPRVSRNPEPIRLRIISEGDLLLEIGKEQDQLGSRLDEALAKLAAAKRNYEFVRNSNGYKAETPEFVTPVQVRSQGTIGDIEKARDIVQTVGREFHRIYRECEVNRLNEKTIEQYRRYVDMFEEIQSENSFKLNLTTTFPRTLGLLNLVQNSLNGGRWAPLVAVSDAENAIYALERELQAIRRAIGEAQSLDLLRKKIDKIRNDQARIDQEIRRMKQDWEERLNSDIPTFGEVGAVFLNRGEKKTISQKIDWNQYKQDEIVVKFSVVDPNNNPVTDGVIVPAEMTLDFEKHQFRFEYTIAGGSKPGDYKVRLSPAVGPPKEFPVTVK